MLARDLQRQNMHTQQEKQVCACLHGKSQEPRKVAECKIDDSAVNEKACLLKRSLDYGGVEKQRMEALL